MSHRADTAFGQRLSRVGRVMLLCAGVLGAARASAAEAEAACGPALALGAQLRAGNRGAVALPLARRAWIATAAVLARCSEGFPDDLRAPAAALTLAQLTAELHRQSRLRADYDLAALRFATVSARWPARPEALEAQLGLAELRLEFGSAAEALEIYRKLTRVTGSAAAANANRRAVRALGILAGLGAGDVPGVLEATSAPSQRGTAAGASSGLAPAPTGLVTGAPEGSSGNGVAGPVVPSHILAIGAQRSPAATRITISTDRLVPHVQGEVPAAEQRPARIYVDLPGASIAPNVTRMRTFPNPRHVLAVRVGSNRRDQARVVVELAEGARAQVFTIERPPSIVIEVRRSDELAAVQELKSPGGLTLSEAAAMPIRRVVVDAGHGGSENGAMGQGGLTEKELTLDVARRLLPLLQRQGLEVILTREGDQTVPLEARTRKANEARADLFISIHVNAAPDRARDGVETYYLDIADDAYARRLAQRENVGSGRSMADLQLLVADLMTRAHTEDSAQLARAVEQSLKRVLRKGSGGVKGVRKALFFVLLGAKMPSVLCELSFISNTQAEREMRDERFRERAARGIADGVAAYMTGRRRRIEGVQGGTMPAAAGQPPRGAP
jgi:N-acetylmuramoyl-L-alanine amidase